jgi:hypothetical protein
VGAELLIIIALVFGIVGAKMADNRGRDRVSWAIACALTGLIGVLILALIGKDRHRV